MGNDSNPGQNGTTLDKVFAVLWFGGILVLGIIVPIYFTMTQSGTAEWFIQFQVWITDKLTGRPRWFPVMTGLVACTIHIGALLGIVKAVSWLRTRGGKTQ